MATNYYYDIKRGALFIHTNANIDFKAMKYMSEALKSQGIKTMLLGDKTGNSTFTVIGEENK